MVFERGIWGGDFFIFFRFGRVLCALLVAHFTYFNAPQRHKGTKNIATENKERKKFIR